MRSLGALGIPEGQPLVIATSKQIGAGLAEEEAHDLNLAWMVASPGLILVFQLDRHTFRASGSWVQYHFRAQE